MYKILVFESDTGWNLYGVHRQLLSARHAWMEAKRTHPLHAIVYDRGPGEREPGSPQLEVIRASVPHPARLLNAAGFRRVAAAL